MRSTSIFSFLPLISSISAGLVTPRYTNSSGTTSKALIDVDGVKWQSLGCTGNQVDWSSFTLLLSSDVLTIETCLKAATETSPGNMFAGLSGDECYVAPYTNNATMQLPDSKCTFACGGDPTETCGGYNTVGKRDLAKRQSTPAITSLLSLYEVVQVGAIIPPSVYISIVVINYVSVCPTGLTTIAYTETMTNTHCGCLDYTPSATIPMTTSVGSCACGPGGAEKTYTVTVPAAVVSGKPSGSPVGPGGPAYTGAANTVKGAGAALFGAVAFAAML